MKEVLKECRKCGKQAYTKVELEEFVKDKKYKDGRTTICYTCNRKRNQEERSAYLSTVEANIDEYLNKSENLYSCSMCKFTSDYIGVFDWHHVNKEEKTFNIGDMKRRQIKWSELKNELDKCVFICANCHRYIHKP